MCPNVHNSQVRIPPPKFPFPRKSLRNLFSSLFTCFLPEDMDEGGVEGEVLLGGDGVVEFCDGGFVVEGVVFGEGGGGGFDVEQVVFAGPSDDRHGWFHFLSK